ncbi:hypothetical protein TREVI0001_0483 [Treponema vincentii ATCC 35580]|uniref:Uncharacterized protein n=1 Tax=Treponema vincentii ATCC 35580 TaxID=596324 RepID=C8PM72_9SPIR|nr:hypothetical protein TREVI0001_0483 [Treponema vincentii ATCC 35580]
MGYFFAILGEFKRKFLYSNDLILTIALKSQQNKRLFFR